MPSVVFRFLPWVLLVASIVGNVWQASRLGESSAREKTLNATVETQNRAIGEWQDAAFDQADRLQDALQVAGEVRVKTRERVRTIIHEVKVPTKCEDAVAWGAKEGASFARRWEKGR